MKPIAMYDDKQGCISKHPTWHTQELVKWYGGYKHLANPYVVTKCNLGHIPLFCTLES